MSPSVTNSRRALALLVPLALVGCGSTREATPAADDCTGVVVFAASSFGPMLADLPAGECPGGVTVSLASSTALAAQVADGAPVDVFVSAGTDAVNSLLSQGVELGDPVTIGFNSASLMVSDEGSARGIESVFDLGTVDAVVGACVPSAPCGRLFDDVMVNASGSGEGRGLDLSRDGLVDTEAANAADLVSKIALGEIDAGIVYESDCRARPATGAVRCVKVPTTTTDGSPLNARVPYVVVRVSSSAGAGRAFAALTSPSFARRLVDRFGIEPA